MIRSIAMQELVSRVSALTVGALALAACGNRGGPTQAPLTTASPIADKVLVQAKDLPDGLDLRLSDGAQGAPAFDHAQLAPAKKLSEADAAAILGRARPLATEAGDAKSFALRPGSQPPPRTGQTIKTSFPGPPSSQLPPAASETGDLQVLRYMPEGKVPLAPELSVTFSQPMIAVTSQDDAAATVPVVLKPQPKGSWRWIGTRTIVFTPDVRFPQATSYAVEISAGTRSATGGALKTATSFRFETPPPTIVSSYPSGDSQRLDAPMFVRFDQQIDAAAVLAHLKVTAGGNAFPIRQIDSAEIAKDKRLAALIAGLAIDGQGAQEGRWVAFRTSQPLPTDSRILVELTAGTPSAEGPNPTTSAQHFSFRTYPPLRIERSSCGYRDQCPPQMPFVVAFNNALDADLFDDATVTVEPAIPAMQISAQGRSLVVSGMTTPHTHYRVVVPAGITDEFHQTLGEDHPLTFDVGAAQPTFFGASGLVVLDPAAKRPTFDVFSTGYDQLKVKLYQVTPADFDGFMRYQREMWNHDHPPHLPGTTRFDHPVKTTGTDRLAETPVDLAPALAASGLGHAIVVVEPMPWHESYEPPRLLAWVQSTKLAVDAHIDSDSLVAFVSELATGKPASGVSLELHPFGITATTDASGLAKLPLGQSSTPGQNYLIARRGEDVAFVAESSWGDGSWIKQQRQVSLAWYVTDDRRMYKPGEQVSLKGWLRALDPGKNGDIAAITGQVSSVNYKVIDPRGNQLLTGSAPVNPLGGFDTTFTLPTTPNLGTVAVQLEARGALTGGYTHTLLVEEFRRPEFEVAAHASQGPFVVGGSGDVTVDAKYFAGGPLPGAPVFWNVSATQTSFTPPNHDDFTFGEWTPWWGAADWSEGPIRFKPPRSWSLEGKTDATGSHVLHLDFLSVKPAMPMSVTASAVVTDVNRQAWSASSTLIVHPADLYVGLKAARPFVDQGTPFDLEVIGVDVDGKPALGASIEVKAVRIDWQYKKGKYTRQEVDPQTCTVTAVQAATPCTFHTDHGGEYRATATIVDSHGRANQTTLAFWVSGGDRIPARDVQQEVAQLIPDKKEYAPGSTAELLVRAPFFPADGIVTWRRSGIVKTERITLDGPTTTLRVPIVDAMVPNLTVQVDLVGAAARLDDHGTPDPSLPKRPAYAVGSIDLPVPATQRALKVSVAPAAAKLSPGETTELAVRVVDAAGHPVAGAEAAVIVVDEAILALTSAQFADPLAAFYTHRSPDARDYYERATVHLARPALDQLAQTGPVGTGMESRASAGAVTLSASGSSAPGEPQPPPPAPMPAQAAPEPMEKQVPKAMSPARDRADSSSDDAPANRPIAIRSDFNPLAAFSPSVHTDAAGAATVTVKLPDNLTRYRIVAIAVAGDKQFGKGESAVTARLPLMVRPSPPRFLNFGDTFRLPVVVQNQTDAAMTVRLAVRTSNAQLTDGAAREVSVPPNDRVEVQFPAAAELAGTARFQIVGTAGRASDAAEVALPVWTPATTEAFATYGVIDGPAGATKQPIALPGKVVTQFGGLEVTTASTNLQALTDALLYLVHYPFECAEQRSSRILAIAALKDVLTAFQTADMPTPAAMATSVADDLEHLSQMQNYDGGFAFWDRGYPSEPYLSVYVASALGHARDKGFTVKPAILGRALEYLRNIEAHYPSYYSKEVRWAISAFALVTRKQLGDLDIAKARHLFAEAGVDQLSMEASGWLLATLAKNPAAADERRAIVRHALNRVSETAGAANFTTGYGDGNYLLLASDRRVDGVMLDALIQEQPDLDLIPKVVTGLLAHRKAGRWLNTQENTFALLALDRYFQTYEKVTPDFVARVWLGNDYAGDHAFRGHTTERHEVDIAMADVASHDGSPLTIQKDGQGRLYYRIGMTYAPASLQLAPADRGFVVERRYEGVDNQADVSRAADGSWHIKAGARVRVRLTLVNQNRRYHVALVDPLPAGLEPMNPALAVTGPIPQDPNQQASRGAYWWWYGPWYEHQNLRDERVEAFASLLWEGVHRYDYVARATTPGNFVVPPTKAEEMYMPETFGRSASDRVVIE